MKKKLMEQKIKELTDESGGVSGLDHIPEPTRHELWVAARVNQTGQYTNEATAVVANKIVSLLS